MSFFASCTDSDNNGNGGENGNTVENGATLKGTITTDVTLESEETENALLAGTSKLKNMTVDTPLKSDKGIYTNEAFTEAGNTVDANLKYDSFAAIKAECDWMAGNWVK